MADIHVHPRLAAGQAAMVDRLNQRIIALRDDGLASLAQANAALRRLPAGAMTGQVAVLAGEIDRAMAALAAFSRDGVPPIEAVRQLERQLQSLRGRMTAAWAKPPL